MTPPCSPLPTLLFSTPNYFSALPPPTFSLTRTFSLLPAPPMLPLSYPFPSIPNFFFPLFGPSPVWLGFLYFLLEIFVKLSRYQWVAGCRDLCFGVCGVQTLSVSHRTPLLSAFTYKLCHLAVSVSPLTASLPCLGPARKSFFLDEFPTPSWRAVGSGK